MPNPIIGITVGTSISPESLRDKLDIPTKVSQLTNDSGYLTKHQDISGKLDASKLPEAIDTALAQAKASGEFDGKDGKDGKDGTNGTNGTDGTNGVSPTVSVSKSGKVTTVSITDKNGTKTATINDGTDGEDGEDGHTPVKGTDYFDGQRGTGLLAVTTAPSSYTTAVGDITPKYRMAISTIKSQSGVTEVLLGDTIRQSYYHYPIAYLDDTYAYCTTRTSIRGATGAAGSDATVTAESIENALGYTPLKSAGWGANKNLGTDENGNVIEKDDIFSKDVSAWKPVEYMDGVAWTELGYYWQADGTHTSTQYTSAYQATQELIRIEPSCEYTLSNFAGTYFLYDSTGKNGVASSPHTNPNAAVSFETNANQYYIGLNCTPSGGYTTSIVSLVRTTISEAEYNALPTRAESLKSLYGKKVVCFGDSLFGMHRGADSAPAFVAAETGATVYNVGFGGCRMSVHPTTGYGAFSMWALAKAIAENDWTTQDAQASSGSSYFPEQLALLKSINFNEVDMVVIHYGTNDFDSGNGVPIDNASDPDDYNSVCGALRYSIEKLLSVYPKLRIYVSLPVYRFWTSTGSTVYAETYQNKIGKTLPEFVEALRTTAAEYNLPVIDGYYGLGINRANATAFLSDGTHHNETGRERFGRYIGQNLISQQTSGKAGASGIDTDAVNALISAAIGNAIGGSY